MPAATKARKKGSAAKAAWVDVETDATGRFTRSNQVLGRGASKVVYKGFDRQQGIEVAWNQVKIVEHLTAKEHGRLQSEVAVLSRLKHRNIMSFYASWIDQQQHTLNFITEYFHPGPLRRHRRNHKHLSRKVLKRWAWQILEGLIYLHGHMPPIIHRDLKCDNIFIHGTTGSVKIGDLGLAKLMEEGLSTCQSVLGTPEFMAPELYREKYNEKVDIYSFGMCLLELVTMEFPYRECKNKAQIFRQVTLGVYPAALQRIEDTETRSFIELCIDHYHERRPHARQLIKHPFFDDVRPERPNSRAAALNSRSDSGQESGRDSIEDSGSLRLSTGSSRPLRPEMLPRPPSAPSSLNTKSAPKKLDRQPSTTSLNRSVSSSPDQGPMLRHPSAPLPLSRTFSVQQRGAEGSTLDFELCMMKNEGADFRRFKFTFDVELDTVNAVAEEFEEEFGLTPTETEHFMELLKKELESMPPKERFIPVELTSHGNDAQGRPDLKVKLTQGEEPHARITPRKPGRKFTPTRGSPHGGRPTQFRSPRITVDNRPRGPDDRMPRSPYASAAGEAMTRSPRELGVSRSPRDVGEQGVVLTRVSGEGLRMRPDRSPSPRVLGASPFDGMDSMKEHRPSPSGKNDEGGDLNLKAYRGDQSRRPNAPTRKPIREQSPPRVVSPRPDDSQQAFQPEPQVPQSPPRAVSPDFQREPMASWQGRGQSPSPLRGGGRSPEPHWAPSQRQESQYGLPGSQYSVPTSQYGVPASQYGVPASRSSPPPYQRQEFGGGIASSSSYPQARSPLPGQGSHGHMRPNGQPGQKWTEPGFHMPTCTPFPMSMRKIKSLFGERRGRGS
ncbi:unnamed protein product [Ostreobium quekettii]|uniref:non-specific serine/threonine protein kinase n=1 Tax=Ostreobium quekettii TaxID=121088 RepID=A0A8S1J8S4_9CHLO|nr:unnamed protein product [Ostreobium quekettii]|eukprot:evm.model.scf_460.6 EVM.evm.TU.scf_460.6   scf_460:67333-73213(-)